MVEIIESVRQRKTCFPSGDFCPLEAALFGVVAPAGTPPAVVGKINAAIDQALAKPAIRERLLGMGMVPVGGPPSDFKTFLERDSVRWAALIKAADIRVE